MIPGFLMATRSVRLPLTLFYRDIHIHQEYEHLVSQFANLKVGLNRFETSEACLKSFVPENSG